MKKTIKLAVVAALALGSTSAFATNGDVMIGQGAKSRSMGGVGVAKSFGAESGLANPALISSVKDSEVTAAVTFFMPTVAFKSDAAAVSQGAPSPTESADSAANFSVIPEVAYATRMSDKLVVGLSMTGTAGMGTDYDSEPFGVAGDNGTFKMKTNLALLKIATPISYDITSSVTVGITPVIQYGTLQMSHMIDTSAPGTAPTGADFKKLESPEASDLGYGYEIGLAYDVTDSLTIAAVHKSKIGMTYEDTIAKSVNAFGGAAMTGITSGDELAQPAETGVGVAYSTSGNTIALDYKLIEWGNAEGYSDFGWENQAVIAVGYEYAATDWALRVGYNYAESPIKEQDGSGATAGMAAYGNSVKNFFNLSGFPGVVETHITVGAGYSISDAMTLDAAVIIVPEVTESFNTSGMTQGMIQGAGGAPTGAEVSSADVTHSQMGINIAMTYKF